MFQLLKKLQQVSGFRESLTCLSSAMRRGGGYAAVMAF